MDNTIIQLIKELKEKHGDDLDVENHHYFLFLKDGVFDIYLDKDEKEFKVNVTLTESLKVYHSNLKLDNILKNS